MTKEQRAEHEAEKKRVYHINGVAVRNSGWEGKPEMITDYNVDVERPSVLMQESYDKDCDDVEEVFCPYCKTKQEDWWESIDPRKEGEAQEYGCDSCERTFFATPSFGYGWKTEPMRCNHGAHQLHVWRQYLYEERTWRVSKCKTCFEHKVDSTKEGEPAHTLLPWKPEYNNPDYFDPKGTLKANAVYGWCKSHEYGCGYQGMLNFEAPDESFEDEALHHWYSCTKCKEEVAPCNILELELKTPVLDQVFRDLERHAWQKEYGRKRR